MKQWLKAMFYNPKHSRPADDNILRLLLPSLIGIAICMVCLAGSTWAWYSASISTLPQTITAANYDLDISVTGADETPVEPTDGVYALAEGVYTVLLEKAGDTGASTGYCVVKTGEETYYTAPVTAGNSLTFTINKAGNYTFTAVWGSYTGNEEIISNGGEIRTQAEHPNELHIQPSPVGAEETGEAVYTVQEGDTLWDIAREYETTVEKIAVYNNVEPDAILQIGQELKIPISKSDAETIGGEQEPAAPESTAETQP